VAPRDERTDRAAGAAKEATEAQGAGGDEKVLGLDVESTTSVALALAASLIIAARV
jgi:hypothetical protein